MKFRILQYRDIDGDVQTLKDGNAEVSQASHVLIVHSPMHATINLPYYVEWAK